LKPDSGRFHQEAHNLGVHKWGASKYSVRRRWPLTIVAVSGAVVCLSLALELRINTTGSMPIGLYSEGPPRFDRGAWVVFCLPEELNKLGRERSYLRRGPCPDRSQELVKEIAAVPGDRVVLTSRGLVVNGYAIPDTALHAVDRDLRILPHAPFGESAVSPGEVWVLGLARRVSWDSRYFGPVPQDHVRGTAIPILTFNLEPSRSEASGDAL